MRNKVIRLAAILLVMILYASTAEAGVIAWYPLHGDATANVGVDGDLINGPTPAPDQNGNPNGALNFQTDPNNSSGYSRSNTGSYVSVQGGAGLPGLQQGTIALWVNWSGMQGKAYAASLSYGQCELSTDAAGASFYSNLWQQMSAEGITTIVASGDSGSTGCDQNAFYAVTFDGTTGEHDLYLDGNLDGSPLPVTMNADTNAPLTIGAWIGDGAGYSNSTIHDLFIFDTVLTQDQLNTLKTTGMPPP